MAKTCGWNDTARAKQPRQVEPPSGSFVTCINAQKGNSGNQEEAESTHCMYVLNSCSISTAVAEGQKSLPISAASCSRSSIERSSAMTPPLRRSISSKTAARFGWVRGQCNSKWRMSPRPLPLALQMLQEMVTSAGSAGVGEDRARGCWGCVVVDRAGKTDTGTHQEGV